MLQNKLQDTDFFVKFVQIMQRNLNTLCLLGFMGSGKSSVGKCLSSMLGAEFADLDELVVAREGKSIPELFRSGEETFRRAEFSALRHCLDSGGGSLRVLALGGGTLCWGPSRELLFSRSSVLTVHLRTSLATIMGRLGSEDSSRPLYADAPRLYAEREGLYAMAELSVDTDSRTVEEVAGEIRDMLGALIPCQAAPRS